MSQTSSATTSSSHARAADTARSRKAAVSAGVTRPSVRASRRARSKTRPRGRRTRTTRGTQAEVEDERGQNPVDAPAFEEAKDRPALTPGGQQAEDEDGDRRDPDHALEAPGEADERLYRADVGRPGGLLQGDSAADHATDEPERGEDVEEVQAGAERHGASRRACRGKRAAAMMASFSRHALEELRADDLITIDAVNALRGGVVAPGELERGTWRSGFARRVRRARRPGD